MTPPAATTRVDNLTDDRVYRVSMDLTMRYLYESREFGEQVLRDVQRNFAAAITDHLERELAMSSLPSMGTRPSMLGEMLDKVIKDTIKDEVRKQVKDAIADRIEEFISEMVE